jgi:hypothetical protein
MLAPQQPTRPMLGGRAEAEVADKIEETNYNGLTAALKAARQRSQARLVISLQRRHCDNGLQYPPRVARHAAEARPAGTGLPAGICDPSQRDWHQVK